MRQFKKNKNIDGLSLNKYSSDSLGGKMDILQHLWQFMKKINIWVLVASQWQPTPVLLPGKSHGWRSLVGCSPWGRWESDTTKWLPTFTFHFHALEKEMATHSSDLAWRIPGTGEPGRLLSMGSHRVRHDWSDLAAAVASRILPWHICEMATGRQIFHLKT